MTREGDAPQGVAHQILAKESGHSVPAGFDIAMLDRQVLGAYLCSWSAATRQRSGLTPDCFVTVPRGVASAVLDCPKPLLYDAATGSRDVGSVVQRLEEYGIGDPEGWARRLVEWGTGCASLYDANTTNTPPPPSVQNP